MGTLRKRSGGDVRVPKMANAIGEVSTPITAFDDVTVDQLLDSGAQQVAPSDRGGLIERAKLSIARKVLAILGQEIDTLRDENKTQAQTIELLTAEMAQGKGSGDLTVAEILQLQTYKEFSTMSYQEMSDLTGLPVSRIKWACSQRVQDGKNLMRFRSRPKRVRHLEL